MRDPHVALGPEVVDLLRLQLVEQLGQRDRVGEIAVMDEKPHPLLMRVAVEVVDPLRVEVEDRRTIPWTS
jgi:hypothetical protein